MMRLKDRDLFKARLVKVGISQNELARRVNVGGSFMSLVVAGQRRIGAYEAEQVAKVLRCKTSALFEAVPTRASRDAS